MGGVEVGPRDSAARAFGSYRQLMRSIRMHVSKYHDGAAMRLVSMLKRRQSCVNFHRVFYEQRSKFYARNAVMPLPVTFTLFGYLLPVARPQQNAHKVHISDLNSFVLHNSNCQDARVENATARHV